MPQLVFQIVDECGLSVGVSGSVSVEDEDAVRFNENSEVEEVDEDGGGPNQDMWEYTGIDFSKISGEETVLQKNICQPENSCIIWGSHTFAINSLFLNSPLARTTFPFSSNSVQRNLGCVAALADILRPRLNIEVSKLSSRPFPHFGISSAHNRPPLLAPVAPNSF